MTEVFDLSDVAPRAGQPVGGGELLEACSALDIRRWAMALDYPNPLHWDEDFARASRFAGLVAPQSFAVGLDFSHGLHPAYVGRVPGSQLLLGGEEWWFYGPRIRPGDRLTQARRFHDYRMAETRFAGPSMIARGDTLHRNQRGEPVAKERATTVRFLAAEAEKRRRYGADEPQTTARWSREALQAVEQLRLGWIRSNRDGVSPRFADVEIGQTLPRRVIGPHSVISFVTEYRAFPYSVWGAFRWVSPPGVADPWINQDPGYIAGFGWDYEGAKIDPRRIDGCYDGPSAGHLNPAKGAEVGIPRAHGFGAVIGAWTTDYLAYWAGHEGFVRHSKVNYRSPAFEGDVTYCDGEVTAKTAESEWGVAVVGVKFRLTNQAGVLVADGVAEVEIPQ
jgi:acyl dehydratase